ncbi:alpha-glucoside-specific PTS transporter subunit IIBC [Amedibacillus sp. YH-ame6]
MKQKIQKFGGAMFTPVLLFAFAGIMVGLATTCMNPQIVGDLANPESIWFKFWSMISAGANTVFNQLPLLFAISLPIALAKKQNARACMETFVIYITFNYFLSEFLNQFGTNIGVDFTADVGGTSGLAMIAGIKTLDTGMIGAIIIAGLAIFLHNRYYEKDLPDYLGVFKGSAFVVMIGFFVMIPVAILVAMIWPHFQTLLLGVQGFFKESGYFGLFSYNILQKLLLPFGVHHFIYAPVLFDNVLVEGGTIGYWAQHLPEFVNSTKPLVEVYPLGGFSNGELAKIFGVIGVALAFYKTANPKKRKMVIALMIPACLTSMMTGITEPLEFTFLFVAPMLYIVYSVLSAVLAVAMLAVGVVGNFGQGIPNIIFLNLVPLFKNNVMMYVMMFVVGIAFIFIYYYVFKFMILKFDYKTPGREIDEDVKLLTKDEYQMLKDGEVKSKDKYDVDGLILCLGGGDNILEISNCATRLRLLVKDEKEIQSLDEFKKYGAIGLVKNGDSIQVIIGLDVPKVRESMELTLGRI